MLAAIALAIAAQAQEPQQPQPGADSQQNAPGQAVPQSAAAVAAMHGVVRNAVSGEPVQRALVSVEGDAAAGALTDGDGKFEIQNLPVGPVVVSIQKPGYLDSGSGGATEAIDTIAPASHNVMLAVDMPDVQFSLTPTGAIRGQVDLSNGDAGEGITLNLMRKVLMGGRASWASAGSTKTRSDGGFRFGGLPAGVYELYSQPSVDSANLNLTADSGRGAATHEWGFATVYYPDARDPSGASKIIVDAGATVQVNLTLVREAFQAVRAIAVPPTVWAGRSFDYIVQVTDISGGELDYPARYDSNSKMIEAWLPDGSYRLAVSTSFRGQSFSEGLSIDGGGGTLRPAPLLEGAVDLQVAGQPVTNLRLALTEAPPVQVQLNVVRSGAGGQSSTETRFVITATQASHSVDELPVGGMMTELASGQFPGPLRGQPIPPGAYWVHAIPTPNGYCESSFTAGGANLAREPLQVGQAGVQAPLQLSLRDDCAKLTLSLPATLEAMKPGEEKYYTVYAVPDFDSTTELQPVTLRPSTGGSMTLNGLTPGNYHVYALEGNAGFEYRNPAALAAMPSQTVALSPGNTADLVVETGVR